MWMQTSKLWETREGKRKAIMVKKQKVQSERIENKDSGAYRNSRASFTSLLESVLSTVIPCYDSDIVHHSLLPTGWRDESDSEENKAAGRNLQGLHSHHVETRHCNRSYCSLQWQHPLYYCAASVCVCVCRHIVKCLYIFSIFLCFGFYIFKDCILCRM